MTPELVGATAQFGLPGLALVVLGGALGRYGLEYLKTRSDRKANTPSPNRAHISEVDASMLTMARQREGLTQDLASERVENTRLREALATEEARNAKRESELRAEIEHLEQKLRSLLDEVTDLKRRTDGPH